MYKKQFNETTKEFTIDCKILSKERYISFAELEKRINEKTVGRCDTLKNEKELWKEFPTLPHDEENYSDFLEMLKLEIIISNWCEYNTIIIAGNDGLFRILQLPSKAQFQKAKKLIDKINNG